MLSRTERASADAAATEEVSDQVLTNVLQVMAARRARLARPGEHQDEGDDAGPGHEEPPIRAGHCPCTRCERGRGRRRAPQCLAS